MKEDKQVKTPTKIIYAFFAAATLACLGLACLAQAVSPPPDGGYPGFTTAEGDHALFSLTSGLANTAVGWYAVSSATTASFNTGIGTGALDLNTGNENTATGVAALFLNTTGANNTANGAFALMNNTTGQNNTALGDRALQSNTTGYVNTAAGSFALYSNMVGFNNTAIGASTLSANVSGEQNSAIGVNALNGNTTGTNNTAIGLGALENNSTGGGNIAIGAFSGGGVTTANSVICIGHNGQDVSNSCYIGQIFGATISNGTAVVINASGKLGTNTSSRRFKEEIRPMGKTSEALFALKPVAFRYKKKIDPEHKAQFGLVAEDVENVNPDLIVRDNDGKPYSVRYDQVNAMLLNEFLKEHCTVQEQKATIAELRRNFWQQQKQIEALTAGLQKVSAQLELSKASPQTVLNQ